MAKYLSATKKDAVNKARYKTCDPKKDWNGQIERILPHIKFILDQNDAIVIGIDLLMKSYCHAIRARKSSVTRSP